MFQLADMLCVERAAYRKNHFPVFRPVNSEHSALPRKILPTEMQVQFQPKVAEMKGIIESDNLRTSSIYEFRKDFARGRRESVRRASCLSRDPLEAVLVDFQRLDLRFESSAGNAQSGSGS